MKKILTLALILVASLTLAACKGETDEGPTDADLVEEARASLLISGLDQVKADMNLPTSGRNNTTITWESSHPDVISAEGVVTRPAEGEDNVDVTLTATITLNDESATRDFLAVVIAEEPSNTFATVADLHANSAKNDIVEFQGIVSSVFEVGYFLTDGTNAIAVFGYDLDPVNIGDEVYVKGSYASYNTLYQISDTTITEVISTGNTVDLAVNESTIPEVNMMDSADKLIHGQHYTIVGEVEFRGEYNNVWIKVGEEDVVVYYESPEASITALEAVVGETIAIEVVYYTDHATDGVRVVFQGGAADITLEANFTDSQKARLAASELTIGDLETIEDFTLPTAIAEYGATVAWSTSDAAIVTDAGVITRDETDDLAATLTATVTVGTESYAIDFPITVVSFATEAATPVTVADVLADETIDDTYLVEGVVSAINSTYGFFIQDADGTAIYVADTFDGVEVGDSVVLRGDLDLWDSYGNYQLKLVNNTLVEDNDGANDVVVITDQTAVQILDTFQTDKSVSSKIYTADLTFSHIDTYGYAFFDASTDFVAETDTEDQIGLRITFKYEDYAPFLETATAGLVLEDVTFVVYDVNFGNLRVVSVEISDDPVTVADALAGTVGDSYKVEGIVSALNLWYGFFIQDADGTAIYVDESFDGVEEGDFVTVRGDLAFNDSFGNGQFMIENVVLEENLKGNEDITIITDQTAVQIADAFQTDFSPSGKTYTADLTFVEIDGFGAAFFDATTDFAAETDTTDQVGFRIKFDYEDYAPFLETATAGLVLENVTFTVYDVHFDNIRVVGVALDETAQYAHLVPNDTVVTVTGTVVFVQAYDGSFYIEDADGTTIYVDDYSHSLGTDMWPTVAVGDNVTVVGDKGFYRVPLVDTVSAITINSSGNAVTGMALTALPMELRDTPNSMNFGQEFMFSNVTVVEVTVDEIVFYVNGADEQEMIIDFEESVDLSSMTFVAGDVISFTAILYRSGAWYDEDASTYYFAVTDLADIEIAVPSLYSTGFETSDGFTAATNYVGGLTDVMGWTVVEGTVTTTGASAEDMQLQMRDYDSAAGFPYAEYFNDTIAINEVEFYANTNQTSGFSLVVQFSTDGTTWSTGETITLTETDTMYTVTSDVTDATYVRFTVDHAETPNKQRVNLDDVVIN